MSRYYAPTAEGLLAPLAPWLQCPAVSEIVLNQPQEVYVEKAGCWQRVAIPEYTERLLAHLFQLIANENGQLLDGAHPMVAASLADGSRIQLVIPPTAAQYTFAIRRQTVQDMRLSDYVSQDYYRKVQPCDGQTPSFAQLPASEQTLIRLFQQQQWAQFLQKALDYRKNIVISGGTASGKTTFLNACLHAIVHTDRIIVLEDTREVTLPQPNHVSLLASCHEQGSAKVSMQQLVQCCLRLRPDRIIMGEIRGKEMLDFIGACATGHSGALTTIHANNPRLAFMRMTQLYKQNGVSSMTDDDILREIRAVVDVIIQLHKTPSGRAAHSMYYKYGQLTSSSTVST